MRPEITYHEPHAGNTVPESGSLYFPGGGGRWSVPGGSPVCCCRKAVRAHRHIWQNTFGLHPWPTFDPIQEHTVKGRVTNRMEVPLNLCFSFTWSKNLEFSSFWNTSLVVNRCWSVRGGEAEAHWYMKTATYDIVLNNTAAGKCCRRSRFLVISPVLHWHWAMKPTM